MYWPNRKGNVLNSNIIESTPIARAPTKHTNQIFSIGIDGVLLLTSHYTHHRNITVRDISDGVSLSLDAWISNKKIAQL